MVVNSTTCGLKERGVASQKVQDGEAVLRVNHGFFAFVQEMVENENEYIYYFNVRQ